MAAFPTHVTNIRVSTYETIHGPAEHVVLTADSGTYTVGTFLMSTYYNLAVDEAHYTDGPLTLGAMYTAECEDDSGTINTIPMHCLSAGDSPSFGQTVTLGVGNAATLDELWEQTGSKVKLPKS